MLKKELESWESDTTCLETPCGKVYLVRGIGKKGHEKCFMFGFGKAGGCIPAFLLATQRLIYYVFKNGGTYLQIVDALKDIHCPNPIFERGKKYDSCLSLIASYYEEEKEKKITSKT
jgi:hypothetical protein